MKFSYNTILFLLIAVFASCIQTTSEKAKHPEKEAIENIKEKIPTQGELVLQDCIAAHGGELYENAHYSFVFREKNYTFKNNGAEYQYTMNSIVKGELVNDSMINNEFSRTIEGKKLNLNEKQRLAYSESLNSVIYFATLPHKLKDESVNVVYQGKDSIKGLAYEVLKITFDQAGGGKDFEDQYYYWVNSETKKIDYLAYNYKVNKGGVRFRSAYNTRVVGGITFQDYINYKAPVGTPLADLPALYEEEKLEELSKIETENIKKLN